MFRRKARDATEQEKDNEDLQSQNTEVQNEFDPPRMQFLGFGPQQPAAEPEPEYIPPVEEQPNEQINSNNGDQLVILQEPEAPPPEEPPVEEVPPPRPWKKDKIVIVLAIALAIIILTLVYFTLVLGTHLDTGTNVDNTPPQPTQYPVPTPTPTPNPTPPTPQPTQIIPPKQIIIGDATINVNLAITVDEQMQGLRYTDRLGPNEGMLYIMNTPDTYPFWGKGMKYPLDIIFISSDKQVVDYAENVQPCQDPDCMMFKPERAAQYIVEANAGFVKEHFVEINDPVVFVY